MYENEYILQRFSNPQKYCILITLNEIVIDGSNNDQVAKRRQSGLNKDSVPSYRTLHPNLAAVKYSTKLPGHTTAKNRHQQIMKIKNGIVYSKLMAGTHKTAGPRSRNINNS